MGNSTWQILLAGILGLAIAACGLTTCNVPGSNSAAPTQADNEPATRPQPLLIVNVDHPFMKWGEPRPDPGRIGGAALRSRTDPTAFWSDAKAIERKVPLTAAATPAARQAIPRPIEPGSDITSPTVLPEPADLAIPK